MMSRVKRRAVSPGFSSVDVAAWLGVAIGDVAGCAADLSIFEEVFATTGAGVVAGTINCFTQDSIVIMFVIN
jgi:hypothetical protein